MAVPPQQNTSIIDLIKDFEGIIGTLFGVFLGSIITLISQKTGRIYFCLNKWDFNLYKSTGDSREIVVTEVSECQFGKYVLEADFFNSSNIPKGLRNIRIIFEGNGFKHEYESLDSDTRKLTSSLSTRAEKMKILTLQPKQLIQVNLEGRINDKTELQNLVKHSKIFLKALDHKNKEFKWRIK